MSDEYLSAVKEEIRFFMEKSFQVSFGYFGAVVALAATVRFDMLDAASQAMGMTTAILLCCSVLLLNTVYLTVAIACLFAILKRGYFILSHTPTAADVPGPNRQWEIYVRSTTKSLFAVRALNGLAWNIDNYYMIPVFVLVPLISLTAVVYPWVVDSPPWCRVVVTLLFVANVLIPGALAWATHRLDGLCRNIVRPAAEKILPD